MISSRLRTARIAASSGLSSWRPGPTSRSRGGARSPRGGSAGAGDPTGGRTGRRSGPRRRGGADNAQVIAVVGHRAAVEELEEADRHVAVNLRHPARADLELGVKPVATFVGVVIPGAGVLLSRCHSSQPVRLQRSAP